MADELDQSRSSPGLTVDTRVGRWLRDTKYHGGTPRVRVPADLAAVVIDRSRPTTMARVRVDADLRTLIA